MIALETIAIAVFFPIFGALLLRALRIPKITTTDAAACGFTITLLVGSFFYDFGVFQFFVPCMLCILALLALAAGRERKTNTVYFVFDKRLALIAFVVGLVALAGRLPVSNFIFAIGDAGAYVNSANHLAATGMMGQQFFPLNQVLLGIFAVIGGPALTPYGVLVASMASVWLAVLLGRAYFGSWRAGWLVGLLISLNVIAMWFGRLPYSESLMLAMNLGALGYWKLAADKEEPCYRHYVLFGLFVALACLDRVTGIIWMLIMSGALLFLCIRKSTRTKPFVLAFLIGAAGYALSIQIALTWGASYYYHQMHAYLPSLHNVQGVVIFHVMWLLALLVAGWLCYFILPRIKFPHGVTARSGVWTFLLFIGFLFIATALFVPDWHDWLLVNAVDNIFNKTTPQDSFYLINYFTVLSIPVFFIGWFTLFRRSNPFNDESWSVFWLFAILFLMISYIRPTYGRSHDVYMYWGRYFLSDTFIVFVIAITAGLMLLAKYKYTKWLALVFIGAYLVQATIWMGLNKDNRYLDNGYRMVAWLASSIPSRGSLLLLDNQYHARWVFPNLRRSLLVPLSHSFGYKVYGVGVQTGPFTHSAFSPDSPVSRSKAVQALDRGQQVYIISASRYGQAQTPFAGSIPMQLIGRHAFTITAKSSAGGRVFAGSKRAYPIVLDIYRLQSRLIDAKTTRHSGFYTDHTWTNGNGRLYDFRICPRGSSRKIVINTYAYIPASISEAEIGLHVDVNEQPLSGKWSSRTSYVLSLPSTMDCVSSIRLRSNTFVPKRLGMNNDTRHLGIDLKSIVIE